MLCIESSNSTHNHSRADTLSIILSLPLGCETPGPDPNQEWTDCYWQPPQSFATDTETKSNYWTFVDK